jgi:hypothetical protein
MPHPPPVDLLPPEARFALRAVAAGVSIDAAGELLRVDGATVRKHLRTAARGVGASAPPPSEGDPALLTALAPAVLAAREPPVRAPSTACPDDDVVAALAGGRLDGPLLLAEIEHAADCPACLTKLVAARASNAPPAAVASPPRRSPWPAVLGAALGLAAACWWLFR